MKGSRGAARAAGLLAGWLWPEPEPCPGCGRPAWREARGAGFCRGCRERLPLLSPPVCACCGKPLRLSAAAQARCADCAGRERVFGLARAAGLYEGELRELLHRLKFRRERALSVPLGRLLCSAFRRYRELRRAEVVVPVPLSPDRLADRGFNQALDLAAVLAQASGRPLVADALLRQGRERAQSLRSAAGRTGVCEGVFRPFRPAGVTGRKVLLVDDVLTTGATAEACAQQLLRAGAVTVDALTVATTVPPGTWQPGTHVRSPFSHGEEER